NLLLHGALGLEALAIAEDTGHRAHATAIAIAHDGIASLEIPVDFDRVPALGVADVVDRDVIMLAPEEWHVGKGRAVARDRAGAGLALPLGDDPMLDPDEAATARVRPSRGIADRIDARGRRLEMSIDDDTVVNPESGLFGERNRRSHADARDDEVGGDPCAVLENHCSRGNTARRLSEVEDDAVLFVDGADEITELRAQHTLERAPLRGDDMHFDVPGA